MGFLLAVLENTVFLIGSFPSQVELEDTRHKHARVASMKGTTQHLSELKEHVTVYQYNVLYWMSESRTLAYAARASLPFVSTATPPRYRHSNPISSQTASVLTDPTQPSE